MTGFALGAFIAFTLQKIWKLVKRKFAPAFPEIENVVEVFTRIELHIKKNDSELAKASYRFWRSVAPRASLLSKKDDPWQIVLDLMRVRYCFESVGVPDSEKESFVAVTKQLEKRFVRCRGVRDGYDIPY